MKGARRQTVSMTTILTRCEGNNTLTSLFTPTFPLLTNLLNNIVKVLGIEMRNPIRT